MAGIYIHIPFCKQFCTYCNFYSIKRVAFFDKFVAAILDEAASKEPFINKNGGSTIYFGGGTPSVLSIEQLELIYNSALKLLAKPPHESTIEVNPDDITLSFAKELKRIGFNRVSMGIQSFNDAHLKFMNRRHTAQEAIVAYNTLREAGFTNISLDLIFGYSMLTTELWRENLREIIALNPEHISAYQMSIEPGSALSVLCKKGEYTPLASETCEQQYRLLQVTLSEAGYEQYEISNFARDGKYSAHNSSYWNKTPYIGLGPGAHSYNGESRVWNLEKLQRYCSYYIGSKEIQLGSESIDKDENLSGSKRVSSIEAGVAEEELLTAMDIFNESIMLGLRQVKGVDLDQLDKCFLAEVMPYVKAEIKLGNLIKEGSVIRIPSDKLFISDSIIRELFLV